MRYIRDFLFYVTIGLALCSAGLWLAACKPGAPEHATRVGVQRASLVTLMRKVQAAPTPTWGADGEPGWTSMRDRFEPACGAFAVKRLGRVQLGTAAHCVTGVSAIRYIPPNGVGLDLARVQYRSEARDVAFLDPENSTGLVPLEMAQAPAVGTHVRAFSPVFDQTSLGTVEEHYEGGWFETSQTVAHGWSGSPDVDSSGRVVGVVAKMPDAPHRALIASVL